MALINKIFNWTLDISQLFFMGAAASVVMVAADATGKFNLLFMNIMAVGAIAWIARAVWDIFFKEDDKGVGTHE